MHRHIDNIISRLTFGIGAVLLTMMVLQITLDAFLRTVFSLPLPGTIEIVTNYYMVSLSFLPMAMTYLRGRHIEASFLYQMLPEWGQFFANWISRALTVVIIILIIWRSFQDAITKTKISAFAQSGTAEIPIWLCYWVIPISFGLLLIVVLMFPNQSDTQLEDI